VHSPQQLTSREAAAILDCSVWTVNRLAASGGLKHSQKLPGLRGQWLFRRTDVERLAASRAKAKAA